MKLMRNLFPLACLALAACGSQDLPQQKSLAQKASEKTTMAERASTQYGYEKNAEGKYVPRSNKRSSFESAGINGQFRGANRESGKGFDTNGFATRKYEGTSEFARTSFGGSTDGSRFQRDVAFGGKSAHEAGRKVETLDGFATSEFATSSARESATAGITTTTNREVDRRREIYAQPDVIDWREQRTMTLKDSKSLLGTN